MYRPPKDTHLDHLTRRFTESAPAAKAHSKKTSPPARKSATAWWVLGLTLLTLAGIVAATLGLTMSR
ncbi:MAG: hypothetical protein MUF31_02295 [Akkermansiaceae bacterium]|jgi:quinol-cytochrome oxidoreductase complex cytochrome b subunit|nr:hypothetical protein [Akkermansiaceae bacterium]